jgi:cysteinyl-tRNA synthetase
MEIKLHNSMSRSLEVFRPIVPGQVTMYVCGPTVYDTPHLGNARPAVIFDTLFRILRHIYGEDRVEYARNYTDIDDKIMDAAKANGQSISTLTDNTINVYKTTMNMLGNIEPTYTPRATGNILPIKGMIAQLLLEGRAYEAEGHVLFDVASWTQHGILSGHKQENLDAGHRVVVTDYKRSPSDFVLWKPSTDDQPGWNSIWGRGRPGWHIECSAMIDSLFASQTIDIHGGGADLRFPHHECEISQFQACNNKPLANYWLHNAMVTVDGQKMSKSLRNFVTVQDVLSKHKNLSGEVIRLALLSTHYRSPLDWTDELVFQARQTLTGWHLALETVLAPAKYNEHSETILSALGNDLNTPLAIARIHEKIGEIATDPEEIAAGVRYATSVMGFNLEDHDNYLRGVGEERIQIEQMIERRIVARKAKDFAESDRLRNDLANMGLVIEDRPNGTKWRYA